MRYIKKIAYLILVFVVYILIIFSFKGNHIYALPVFQLILFGLVVYFYKRKNLKTLLISYLFFLAVMFVFCFADNDFSRGSAYFIYPPITIGLSLLKLKYKWLIAVLLPFIVLSGFIFYPNSFVAVNMLHNSKTVKQVVNKNINNIHFITRDSTAFTFDKDKTYILDFWNRGCKSCYKNFPKFKKLSETYTNLEFYTIFVPYSSSIEKDLNVFDKVKKHYNFNAIIANNNKQLEDSLVVKIFPNYFIIKNNKVYKSHLNLNKTYILFNNLYYTLKSL